LCGGSVSLTGQTSHRGTHQTTTSISEDGGTKLAWGGEVHNLKTKQPGRLNMGSYASRILANNTCKNDDLSPFKEDALARACHPAPAKFV